MTEQLTHIDEHGDVRMVDVSQKADTERVAVAEGFISMKPETLALIVEGKAAKGDVLACARLPASDSGMPLKNAPVPHDGSSTLPPAKPMASIASHIGRTIPGGV